VAALYTSSAAYPKVNWAGFVAFLIPVGITLLAITADVFTWFYNYGWFTGSISGAIIYYFAAGKLVNTVNTNVGELAKAS
jgi:NCS1 family nucleobase:cation symporter-1